MKTAPEPTYDGQGLLNTGCTVAYLQPLTPLYSYMYDGLACIVVPGSPCDALLAFTEISAVRFVRDLDERVREAQRARGVAVTGLAPALADKAEPIHAG